MFLSSMHEDAFLCSGEELMIALGLGEMHAHGQLYELNTETKTGRKIC